MDRGTVGWIDKQTDGPKSGLQRCMNDIKTFKTIYNVFELAETPLKQLSVGQTDGPTDQLTNQKVAYRGL